MAWSVTDSAFWSSFTNGTFETVFSTGFYPQNPVTYRYRAKNIFQSNNTFAHSGARSARLQSADCFAGTNAVLELYAGKARTAGRRYTITGWMMFKPSLTPGIWNDANVIKVIAKLFGTTQTLWATITTIRDGWHQFSIQAVNNLGDSPAVDSVKLQIEFEFVSAAFFDPLNGSDIYFDDILAIEESEPADLDATSAHTDCTANGADDGTITISGFVGSGSYQVTFPFDASVYPTSGAPVVKSGLPPDTYTIEVKDLITEQTLNLFETITEPTPTPPQGGTHFFVPKMQSLTFVQKDSDNPDDCETFQTLDNTLFCEEVFEGMQNPGYFQKVAKCDVFPIQWESDFPDHVVSLRKISDDSVISTYPAILKEQNTGIESIYPMTLQNHGGGKTRAYFNIGGIPIPLNVGDSMSIINNADGFNGDYAIESIQDDELQGTQYLVINKNYAIVAPSSAADGKFITNMQDFNIYEALVNDLAAKADGNYYFTIEASSSEVSKEAISEPIYLTTQHEGTNLVEFRCFDNAFDVTYTTGITNRIRVESRFFKRRPSGTRVVLRNSDESIVKVSARKRRGILFEAWQLPPYMHEKLSVVFDCDVIKINGVEYQTDLSYQDPNYIERYALSNSSIVLEQVKWFKKINSNDLGGVDQDTGFIIANGGFLKR